MAVIEELIDSVDVNYQCDENRRRTPLSYASDGNHIGIVEKLLAHPDIRVDLSDKCGWTPAHYAAERGLLLQNVAAIDVEDEDRRAPNSVSAQYGYLDCLKLLIGAGANPKQKLVDGCTALLLACSRGHIECEEFLLSLSDIDAQADNGLTALYWANKTGRKECADLLLKGGAKL